MRAHWSRIALSVLVPAVVSIPVSHSAAPVQAPPQPADTALAGQRAYIDPSTGKLLPGPPPGTPQAYVLTPALAPDDSKLEVVHWPNGALQVRLHGQRQATVYATLGKDGQVETHCVEGTSALSPLGEDRGHE